jgi:hypothetical protein
VRSEGGSRKSVGSGTVSLFYSRWKWKDTLPFDGVITKQKQIRPEIDGNTSSNLMMTS